MYDSNESIWDEKVIKTLENVGTSFSFFDKPVFLHSSYELLIELIREDEYQEYYHKYEVEKREIFVETILYRNNIREQIRTGRGIV